MRYFKQCYIFAALEIHHQMVDNKFVVDSFLEACQNPDFQGKWMTSATWGEVISRYYALSPEVSYVGKNLFKPLVIVNGYFLLLSLMV